jgi:hypothetical protein
MNDTTQTAPEPLSTAVQQWIAALRSGKYTQGKNYLNADGSLCCLGVACEIFKDELNLNITTTTTIDIDKEVTRYNRFYGVLPQIVSDHLGLSTCYGSLSKHDYSSLYSMNDNGKTFAEIADIIESKPEGLFKS